MRSRNNVFNILDVGCGFRPEGDVNVDLYVSPTLQRDKNEWGEDAINLKAVANFVLADGQHLPFKNDVFPLVKSWHTMEHVENPVLFLKELIRVAKHKIEVHVPHRYRRGQPEEHINRFSGNWFHRALRNYIHNIEVSWKPIPHVLFPLFRVPDELKVTIWKNTHVRSQS